jgi:hypothetical protein
MAVGGMGGDGILMQDSTGQRRVQGQTLLASVVPQESLSVMSWDSW